MCACVPVCEREIIRERETEHLAAKDSVLD